MAMDCLQLQLQLQLQRLWGELQLQLSTWRFAMVVAAALTGTLLSTLQMSHIAHARCQIAQLHWVTALVLLESLRSPASIIRL
jgi:hypothetical protein